MLAQHNGRPRLETILSASVQEASAPAAKKKPQSGVGFLLLLNVEAEAPVITMPRSSDSQDFLEVDLGTLKMTNHIDWLFGTNPRDKKASPLLAWCI